MDPAEKARRVMEWITGSATPNYKRGQRYCPNCRLAFYTIQKNCPYCGTLLRSLPKRTRKERKSVDPERYGVRVEA